jgi:hypothetical protein
MIDEIEAYIGIGEMLGVRKPSTESIEEKMPRTGARAKFSRMGWKKRNEEEKNSWGRAAVCR